MSQPPSSYPRIGCPQHKKRQVDGICLDVSCPRVLGCFDCTKLHADHRESYLHISDFLGYIDQKIHPSALLTDCQRRLTKLRKLRETFHRDFTASFQDIVKSAKSVQNAVDASLAAQIQAISDIYQPSINMVANLKALSAGEKTLKEEGELMLVKDIFRLNRKGDNDEAASAFHLDFLPSTRIEEPIISAGAAFNNRSASLIDIMKSFSETLNKMGVISETPINKNTFQYSPVQARSQKNYPSIFPMVSSVYPQQQQLSHCRSDHLELSARPNNSDRYFTLQNLSQEDACRNIETIKDSSVTANEGGSNDHCLLEKKTYLPLQRKNCDDSDDNRNILSNRSDEAEQFFSEKKIGDSRQMNITNFQHNHSHISSSQNNHSRIASSLSSHIASSQRQKARMTSQSQQQ